MRNAVVFGMPSAATVRSRLRRREGPLSTRAQRPFRRRLPRIGAEEHTVAELNVIELICIEFIILVENSIFLTRS